MFNAAPNGLSQSDVGVYETKMFVCVPHVLFDSSGGVGQAGGVRRGRRIRRDFQSLGTSGRQSKLTADSNLNTEQVAGVLYGAQSAFVNLRMPTDVQAQPRGKRPPP